MQTKKTIYYWAADISNNSGEGILANSIINNYAKEKNIYSFKNLNFKDSYQKKNNFKNKKFLYESNIHKYIYPFVLQHLFRLLSPILQVMHLSQYLQQRILLQYLFA